MNKEGISIKTKIIFILSILSLLVLIIGCLNEIKIQGDKVIVEKRIGESYELHKEIEDSAEVKNIKNLIQSINWENAVVCMAYPPDYIFNFEESKEEKVSYELWISPSKEIVELIIEDGKKYAKVNKEKSEELFKLLTGKTLGED